MGDHDPATRGITRRRFLGYLIAGPTFVAAAQLPWGLLDGPATRAYAAIPSPPEPADHFDLTDLLTEAAAPTAGLITVMVNPDGTVSFALPRAEVGQGITTAVAMTIADEMDLPSRQGPGHARRRPARADLEPAHRRLELDALDLHPGPRRGRAARAHSCADGRARARHRVVAHRPAMASSPRPTAGASPSGRWHEARRRSIDRGARRAQGQFELHDRRHPAERASTPSTSSPAASSSRWTSTCPARCRRWCAGRRRSTARSLSVRTSPRSRRCQASPTSRSSRTRCRRSRGGRRSANASTRSTRSRSCGAPGTADAKSDANVLAELTGGRAPAGRAAVPLLTKRSTTRSRSTSAATARSRPTARSPTCGPSSAEIWSSLKSPIVAQEQIADALGLPVSRRDVHVAAGRRLVRAPPVLRRRARGGRDLARRSASR